MLVRNTLDASARTLRMLGMAVVLVLVLSGCSSYFDDMSGIDAIAPSGRWVTVTEYKGDPKDGRLILLDLQDSPPTLLADGFTPLPVLDGGSFSPDGRFVLLCSEAWLLLDRTSGQPVNLSESLGAGGWAEFLPSGELLLISGSFEQGLQFDLIRDPAQPQQRVPLISNVRYFFAGHQPPLFALLFGQTTGASSLCEASRTPDHRAWTTVDKEGVVTILRATPDGIPPLERLPHLSSTITDLLERQRALVQNQRDEIEKSEREKLLQQSETVDPQELERRVAERLEALVLGSIAALPSPDGTKLFFMRLSEGDGDSGSRYTLYLLDLEKGTETPLSTETHWPPYFAFSPDGTQILFESNQGYDVASAGTRALYIADANAGNIRRLDVPEGSIPCWH